MSLNPETLTWTALLGQWVDFARASLALPRDGHGERWRQSVVAVINLQAVTFALGDIDRLAADEVALALDRALLVFQESAAALRQIWGDAMPESLSEIVGDASIALAARQQSRAHQPGMTDLD